jgi:plastocyanin
MRREHSGARLGLMRSLFLTLALTVLGLLPRAKAADLSTTVVDRNGHGVGQVVVTVDPVVPSTASMPAHHPAVMDQKALAFVPLVLVVGTGSSVEFPNNDLVSHQVYSFSAAKHFQLPLYKGERHPPITFDQPGLVVLGCNIHDSMIGYIYVTSARYFGTTEADGTVLLKALPAGDYRVDIWSPYITDPPTALSRTVHVDVSEPTKARVQLGAVLRAQPEPKPRRRDWEY